MLGQEKQAHDEVTGFTDYAGAMFRQDSPVDGSMAYLVGEEYKHDPRYNPYEAAAFAEDSKGISPEFSANLYAARSPAHRIYIRDRLLQKQADLEKLGDLGVPGNVGRIAMGALDPTNWALAVGSGGALTVTRMAVPALARAGRAAQIGVGLAEAGASGYAFERARQSVNFEDSQGEALGAALMSVAFSAPFVGLNAKQMGRVRSSAERELANLNALKAHADTGTPPPPETLARFEEVHAVAEKLAKGEDVPAPEMPHVPTTSDELLALIVARENEAAPPPTPKAKSDKADVQVQKESPVGRDVTWDNGSRQGLVVGETERGKFIVEDESGKRFIVDPQDVDGAELGETPGFLPGSVGSAQVEHIVDDPGAPRFTKARFDISARLGDSENPLVRALGYMLVKDPLPRSDHFAQSMSASEDKRLYQRRDGGAFHWEANQAFHAAQVKAGRKLDDMEFFNDVGRAVRDPSVLNESRVAPYQGELARAVTAFRTTMDNMLKELKRAGVKGADTVAENPAYATRIWNVPKILELSQKHGPKVITQLVANAITNPKLRGDVKVAGKFLTAVKRLEHSSLSTDLLFHATDEAAVRDVLKNAKGMTEREKDALIDVLFVREEQKGEGDAGNPPQLKYRFQLDETATISTAKGDTISLLDLVENDARVLTDRYLNSMGGRAALAKRGITSDADFRAKLEEITQDHATNELSRDAGKHGGDLDLLNDVYANITGRPMSVHSFNTGDRIAGFLRTVSRTTYLGQLGFTAATEMTHAAALATWGSAIRSMPAFAQAWRAMAKGYVPEGSLLDDMRAMIGAGNEHVASYARQHEITDFTYDKKLTSIENWSNKASHAVDRWSGNNWMTSYTRFVASAMMTQKYADISSGRIKVDKWRERMVGAGINAPQIDDVMSALKQHTVRDADGRVQNIKWEEWSAADPDSYGAFTTAVTRDVRQGIQDHDLGETWYFSHTSIGKILTELRQFPLAAWSKQTLNGAHYRDGVALQLWTTSFVTSSLGYMMQTSMNFAHNPDELRKRMAPEKIVKAAVARMNVLGIAPFVYDIIAAGAAPQLRLSGEGMTANTGSRSLLPPSYMLLERGVNTFGAAGQSAIWGENFTGRDVKNAAGLIPFNNIYGARNIVDWMAEMAPKSELKHAP